MTSERLKQKPGAKKDHRAAASAPPVQGQRSVRLRFLHDIHDTHDTRSSFDMDTAFAAELRSLSIGKLYNFWGFKLRKFTY